MAAQVIEKPAGRRDDELRLLSELVLLPLDVLPAVNERRSYADRIRERLGDARRLHGQLARRADDESLRDLGISLDALKQGQQEGERLARARLRLHDGVASRTHGRNRLLLHGSRFAYALTRESVDQHFRAVKF